MDYCKRCVYPANARPGIVLEQYPAAGTLSAFDRVKLVVAKAKDGVVPKVVGLTLYQAQLTLTDDQLEAEVEAYVDDADPGVVVSQAPAAGLAASPSRTVTLVVGR